MKNKKVFYPTLFFMQDMGYYDLRPALLDDVKRLNDIFDEITPYQLRMYAKQVMNLTARECEVEDVRELLKANFVKEARELKASIESQKEDQIKLTQDINRKEKRYDKIYKIILCIELVFLIAICLIMLIGGMRIMKYV